MATGAEAVEAIAKTTGMSPYTVGGAARALREAKLDLWPQGGRGGGRNASHVHPHHLVNLAVALAVANPLTAAASQVVPFTSLSATPARLPASGGQLTAAFDRWKKNVGCTDLRIVPGETLGDALAGLVDWISRPEGAEIGVICKGLHVVLFQEDGYDNHARVSYFEPGTELNGWANFAEYYPAGLPLNRNVHHTMFRTPGTIQRSSRMKFDLIKVLADLWLDTRGKQEGST